MILSPLARALLTYPEPLHARPLHDYLFFFPFGGTDTAIFRQIADQKAAPTYILPKSEDHAALSAMNMVYDDRCHKAIVRGSSHLQLICLETSMKRSNKFIGR